MGVVRTLLGIKSGLEDTAKIKPCSKSLSDFVATCFLLGAASRTQPRVRWTAEVKPKSKGLWEEPCHQPHCQRDISKMSNFAL